MQPRGTAIAAADPIASPQRCSRSSATTAKEADMQRAAKAYKGPAMEGRIADWYARNTKGAPRFCTSADALTKTLTPGARILEVAPGPGYLAIELARRGFRVTGLDISES